MALATAVPTFATLYHEYAPDIHRYLTRLVQSHEVAEELAQDTWVKVFTHLEETAARGNFQARGWLYSVATNRATDYLRRGQSQKAGGRVHFLSLDGGSGPAPLLPRAIEARTPESVVCLRQEHQETSSTAALVFELLSVRQRRVLWYREWCGDDYDTIARKLRQTRAAIKSLLHRARERQRELTPYVLGQRLSMAVPTPPTPLISRVWSFVPQGERADPVGCWPWQGYRRREEIGGEPILKIHSKTVHINRDVLGHRLLYAICRGPIPPWAFLVKQCGHAWCVNPWHVYLRGPIGHRQDTVRDDLKDVSLPPQVDRTPWHLDLRAQMARLALNGPALAGLAGLSRGAISNARLGKAILPTTRAVLEATLARREQAIARGELPEPLKNGEELRQRRRALGLSRMAFAQLAGCTDAAVRHYERDAATVSARTRLLLGFALARLEATPAEEVRHG